MEDGVRRRMEREEGGTSHGEQEEEEMGVG